MGKLVAPRKEKEMKNVTQVFHFENDKCLNSSRSEFLSEDHLHLHNRIVMFGKVDSILKAMSLNMFRKVAHVQTENLEDVFRLTNHIEGSWTENEGVGVWAENVRSTSVGDVLINDNGVFVVAPCGFEKVGA
jgi:hypothetical protein